MKKWSCVIPGKQGTIWEGGAYPLNLEFPDEYPTRPPIARFPAGFFHPNIYPSGKVCLSILNEEKGWRPSITIKSVLTGIQELLSEPNMMDPAQEAAYYKKKSDNEAYEVEVKMQAKLYPAN